MSNAVDGPPRAWGRLREFVADRRVRGAGLIVIAVSVALLNGVLARAWFPALTVLDSRTANLVLALCAGITISLAGRFPLWVLAAQGALVLAVAVLPSLTVAALIVGWRRGVRPWKSWCVALLAATAVTLAPWMPPNGRVIALFIVLLPYGVGALVHALGEQRRTEQERMVVLLKNASLREEQSALREHQRLADELHDRLGHQLTAIEIQTRLLTEEPSDAGAVAKRAVIAHDAAARAIDEVQSIVRKDPIAGIAEALVPRSLTEEAQSVARSLDVPLTCTIVPGASELPFDVEYTLLRVVQEALTNAARHAPGQPVALRLNRTEIMVTLTISNPAQDAGTHGTGRGIPSLANRVSELGGTLSAGVDDGSRFVLEISLPLDRSGADQ